MDRRVRVRRTVRRTASVAWLTGSRVRRFSFLLLALASVAAGMLASTVVRSLTAVSTREVAIEPRLSLRQGGARVGGDGPVLRVFGDYECGACRELERVAGDSLRALARYGRMTFVYHHAPLRAHRRGPLAAAAAYCAGTFGSPWAAHRAFYQRVPLWNTGDNPLGRLAAAAAHGGADPARLRSCLEARATVAHVERDRVLADELGIDAVPTVFLDEERIMFRSYRALLRYVTRRALAS